MKSASSSIDLASDSDDEIQIVTQESRGNTSTSWGEREVNRRSSRRRDMRWRPSRCRSVDERMGGGGAVSRCDTATSRREQRGGGVEDDTRGGSARKGYAKQRRRGERRRNNQSANKKQKE
jgi:hypothetical protein